MEKWKLDNSYIEAAISLLRQNPALNIYSIKNIQEKFGKEDFYCYGYFFRDEMIGIIIFNDDICNIYISEGTISSDYLDLLTRMKPKRIVGQYNVVTQLLETISDKIDIISDRVELLCSASEEEFNFIEKKYSNIEYKINIANTSDIKKIVDFYKQNEDLMKNRQWSDDALYNYFREKIQHGLAYVEYRNKVISGCDVLTSISDFAILGVVFTLPRYRKKNFASQCVSLLCKKLFSDGKKVCLYFDENNIGAKKLYNKLGFEYVTKMKDIILKWEK